MQQEIEKRTGVHIEWDTYSSDVETVLQTRLASMEGLPDMVELPPFDSNVGVDTYSANGVPFLPSVHRSDYPLLFALRRSGIQSK